MKSLTKILLVFSPVLAAFIAGVVHNSISENSGNMATGVVLLGVIIIGVPFVGSTGLMFGFITRNSTKDKSIWGYFVAALITWIYALIGAFS